MKLTLAIFLLSLATLSIAKIAITDFGHLSQVRETEDSIHKTITLSRQNVFNSYAERYRYLKEAKEQMKENKNNELLQSGEMKCESEVTTPDYFNFGQAYLGSLTRKSRKMTIESLCFQTIDFEVTYSPQYDNFDSFSVVVTPHNKRSWLCKDIFLVGGANVYHFEQIFWEKQFTIEFKNLKQDDKDDILNEGVRLFQFCSNYWTIFRSLIKTVELFLGGIGTNPYIPFFGSHVPSWMVEANVELLEEYMEVKMVKRPIQEVEIDESLIHSGDFFTVQRFDGLDQIIELGTGSHSGHSVTALRIDGELHIVESQDGWYWPKHGIQRNPWKQWIKWAKNADFHVCWLPLREEYRQKYDEKKAYEFFQTVEGLPYGYHNFLFSWIDTPEKNYPYVLPPKLVPIAFQIFDSLLPSVGYKFLDQAINKRLGTEGLYLHDLFTVAYNKGYTMEEVFALPQIDGWVYNDGVSYVCSCFVIAMFKASGMLGDVKINATEFSPKDVYQIDVYDTKIDRPQACKDADPDLPYCQLLGEYRMQLPGYSSIPIYDNMNENCESLMPKYFRPDGC